MKLKSIIALILFPLALHGAVTNKLDNILTTGSFQFTAGAPGVAKVFTSDAAGYASWLPVPAATGPFAITNGFNFFMANSTNQFKAPVYIDNHLYLTNGVPMIIYNQTDNVGEGLIFQPSNANRSGTVRLIPSGNATSVGLWMHNVTNTTDLGQAGVYFMGDGANILTGTRQNVFSIASVFSGGGAGIGNPIDIIVQNGAGSPGRTPATTYDGTTQVISNYWNVFNTKTTTSSNFVQAAGSQGGFVGNAFGLTNFPPNVVVTNGAQRISGAKTFTDTVTVEGSSSIDTGTNAVLIISVNGGTGTISNMALTTVMSSNLNVLGSITMQSRLVPSVYVTNVMADFPSILAASQADISYPVPSFIITNAVCTIGPPSTESASLAVNSYISSNGFVTIRARNVGSIAVDQGNLPYRLQMTVLPITSQ